jgi:hypothetical protein
MTRYLLAVHTGADESPASMTEEQAREGYARISALEQEMEAADALVFSGRLGAPDSARVVQAGNGKVLTTDGPYLEAKEAIGGFYIVEAPSLNEALAWASKTSAAVGMPIEVRPFFDSRQPEGG